MNQLDFDGRTYTVFAFAADELFLHQMRALGSFEYHRHRLNAFLKLRIEAHDNAILVAEGIRGEFVYNEVVPLNPAPALIVRQDGVTVADFLPVETGAHMEVRLTVPAEYIISDQYHRLAKLHLLLDGHA